MYTTLPIILQRRRCKLIHDGARFFSLPSSTTPATVHVIFACFLVLFGVGVVFFLCCFLDLSWVFEAFVTCLLLFSEVFPGSGRFLPFSRLGSFLSGSLGRPGRFGPWRLLWPSLAAGPSLSFSAADEKALPQSEPCDG